MNQKRRTSVNEKEMQLRANLNNIEPGDSVNEHRNLESANIDLAGEELQQQNNNHI